MFSQEDAWVFFSDKENVETAISNPITILTQKAIDRKANHGVSIDERDVPVNETYITQIKNSDGITVWAKSKWFNAVHVRGTEVDINLLLNLSFVDHIDFANNDLNASREAHPVDNKFENENLRTEFTYGNTQNQIEMLNLHVLHQSDYTGEGMTVAILDAGFRNVHTMNGFQRLRDANKLLDGYDFVARNDDEFEYTGNTHGTKVLSTMAGFIQDSYVGTAPDASYYLFRTEDVASENPVEESYWVEAAERADSLGVDIINTSLGYKGYDNPNYSHTNSDLDGFTTYITKGANIAAEKGMLLVNSAGNSGTNGVNAPADSPNILSIGAVDMDGNYVSFSSQGSDFQPTIKPDVMARGHQSFVIAPSDNIVQNNGTSFSSPILAGGVACLWQALPEFTNSEIMDLIRESASQYETPDYIMGHGIPDFQLALEMGLIIQNFNNSNFKIFPNPIIDDLQLIIPNDLESVELYIFDVLGKLVYETAIEDQQTHLNLEYLTKGVYLLRILAAGDTSKTLKLIKK
jgi:subtilisin family serine protease